MTQETPVPQERAQMNKAALLRQLETLPIPKDSYVVFGSGPLAVAGIRDAKDIDLFVSPSAYAVLKAAGWKEHYKGPGDVPLTFGVFEAHDNWDFSKYSPTFEHLYETAAKVDGIAFASLEEVRKWKQASGIQKHLDDIELIDEYLAKQKG